MGARAQPLGEITGQLQALRIHRLLFFLQSAIKCWQTLREPTVLRAFRDTWVLQPPHFDVKKASRLLASPTCGCAIAWRDNHPGQSGFPGQIQMEAALSLNENLEIFNFLLGLFISKAI